MYILGISAYYHDSAAVLLKNGKVICGIEEERFSRIKHDNSFPQQAVQFCLNKARITINDIDAISYYEKPLLKFERVIDTFIATFPHSLIPFVQGIPEWLSHKIKIEHVLRSELKYKGRVYFTPHHASHAAACFYPSPFKESAILTIDGVGEYQTTGLWHGKGKIITPLKQIDFPHSLGLLYSTFTAFLGFKVNEDEFKVMGLSAYGKPDYANKIRRLIDIKQDGSFALDLRYFSFRDGYRMWNGKFESLFGGPRKKDEPLTNRHKDIAASIQQVMEEVYFKILNHLHFVTGLETVCISGGVGLNALANGKIYKQTPFKQVYVFGAAGDSGAALGSALYTQFKLIPATTRRRLSVLSFGSSYKDPSIVNFLKKYNLKYKKLTEKELIRKCVKLLVDGKILGWFQGKAELGPRALGNHSIICRPNPRDMKRKMNIIKRREQFRPFAGSILQEKVHEYFDVPEKNHWSPFMVFCFHVKKDKRKDLAAIVHKDNTCRIQTVNEENGSYHLLIREFYRQTGVACILNTSFNVMGEPIVETPEQAILDFLQNKMDCLAIGSYFVTK